VKPMTPMKPMEPLKPMEPMTFSGKPWWPDDLGEPSTAGSQGKRRYAFFPEKRRLLIDEDGSIAIYDSADQQISGVSQAGDGVHSLRFSTRDGSIDLDQLARVD
jgi:hypothetical protein